MYDDSKNNKPNFKFGVENIILTEEYKYTK